MKWVLAAGLIVNFGMLGHVKYTGFLMENLNAIFSLKLTAGNPFFPLGISFYTFQSSGYLIDVYWKKIPAQKNPFRYALFVSFFPQLMQGPISMYDELAPQLYASHKWDIVRICRGLERILFGLFKKLVIADWAAVFVDAITGNPGQYQGLAGICLMLYYIELYMDFSGAMDVVIGIGELFGIQMPENFRRPYLAASLSEFWRRWHITLGAWMMRYVFYPLSLSSVGQWIGRTGKRKFGRKAGRSLQIAFSTFVVFLLVGIWHGANWISIMFGFSNGLVISSSELLAPVYGKLKKNMGISGSEKIYVLFCILRTQFIFCLESIFDCSGTVKEAGRFLLMALTRFDPETILQIPAGRDGTAGTPWALLIILAGTALVVILGCRKELSEKASPENPACFRERIAALPYPVALCIFLLLFASLGFLGCTGAPKGFIYAQF